MKPNNQQPFLANLLLALSIVATATNAFAGTTFFSSAQYNPTPDILYSISSNSVETSMDLSGFIDFGDPEGMAVDTNGNLFVAFSGDAIAQYTSHFARLFVTNIGAPSLLCFDSRGTLYGNSNDCVIAITTNGASIYASGIQGLNGLCFDQSGNLYVSTPSQILCITPLGATNIITTAAIIDPPPPPPMGFNPSIRSLAIDIHTNLYAAIYEGGPSERYIFQIGQNGAGVGGMQIPGSTMSVTIAVDEFTNYIYAATGANYGLDVNGPFGAAYIGSPFKLKAGYLAYSPLNEVIAQLVPYILKQPSSLTLPTGSDAYFDSTASGTTPLTYQWYFNSVNLIPGATNTMLVLTNVSPSQSGQYTMVASNYLGTVTNQAASLSVLPTLTVTMVPGVNLFGQIGSSYTVQYINATGPTNAWVSLVTVTLTNSPQFYFDVSAIGQPSRFYRSFLAH